MSTFPSAPGFVWPLPSPYNFVPIPERIYHPPWAANVSHDVPFADGICGSFEITVTAATPIYIRNGGHFPEPPAIRNRGDYPSADTHRSFYRLYPDGPFAIPGSSLKGMIRAVVEIAALGKFGRLVGTDVQQWLARPHRSPNHTAPFPPDLAETIFGFAEDKDGLRSRVSFDTLPVVENTALELGEVEGVLAGPHPDYAPAYIVQSLADPKTGKIGTTLVSPGDNASRPRGWKRYPARETVAALPDIPYSKKKGGPNLDVATRFRPLDQGVRFTGRARVHNLRPAELGGVVWALTWGGDTKLRHALGLAKPCGYGGVTIAITPGSEQLCRVDGQPVALTACRDEFVRTMEAFLPGWAASEPLQNLHAMANPFCPPPAPLVYATREQQHAAENIGYALLPYVAAFLPAGFIPPQRCETRRCIVLPGTTPSGLPRLKTEGDPGDTSHGSLTARAPVALSPGMVVECVVKSVAPRSHAYAFVKIITAPK